jgi:hypothetical protein
MAGEKAAAKPEVKTVEFIRVTPGKTSKVFILASTMLHGVHIEAGRTIEVEEKYAYELIVAGKARKVAGEEAK